MEVQMDSYQLLINKKKLLRRIRRIRKEGLIIAFSY
jgi:hypothetical protein